MLTRIKIQGFKSLVDVDVQLQPLTVLFGPNAAGKSNFLDALQLISRIVTSDTAGEAFTPPYRGTALESFAFGPGGLSDLLARPEVELSLEIDVRLSDAVVAETEERSRQFYDLMIAAAPQQERDQFLQWRETIGVRERNLRYRLKLQLRPRSGLLSVLDEQVLPLTKKGHPKKLASSNFTDREKTFDRLHIRQSFARSRLSAELPHSAFPHFRALQQELAQWAFFYFEPRERMRRPDAVQETRRLGGRGENLASFLNTLRATEPRQFAVVERALHLLIPSLSGVELGVNERGVMELHLRENGALIPASLLSDGTLRLLGMLALSSMKDKPTLIGFEEPENGVHPRRMRLIAELLKSYVFSGETQMIVTTHSPTLLDALPRENLYVCRKREGSTTITPLNQLDPLGLDTSITYALDGADDELMVSERVLRGDFDA